jgi:hypothetical protein
MEGFDRVYYDTKKRINKSSENFILSKEIEGNKKQSEGMSRGEEEGRRLTN